MCNRLAGGSYKLCNSPTSCPWTLLRSKKRGRWLLMLCVPPASDGPPTFPTRGRMSPGAEVAILARWPVWVGAWGCRSRSALRIPGLDRTSHHGASLCRPVRLPPLDRRASPPPPHVDLGPCGYAFCGPLLADGRPARSHQAPLAATSGRMDTPHCGRLGWDGPRPVRHTARATWEHTFWAREPRAQEPGWPWRLRTASRWQQPKRRLPARAPPQLRVAIGIRRPRHGGPCIAVLVRRAAPIPPPPPLRLPAPIIGSTLGWPPSGPCLPAPMRAALWGHHPGSPHDLHRRRLASPSHGWGRPGSLGGGAHVRRRLGLHQRCGWSALPGVGRSAPAAEFWALLCLARAFAPTGHSAVVACDTPNVVHCVHRLQATRSPTPPALPANRRAAWARLAETTRHPQPHGCVDDCATSPSTKRDARPPKFPHAPSLRRRMRQTWVLRPRAQPRPTRAPRRRPTEGVPAPTQRPGVPGCQPSWRACTPATDPGGGPGVVAAIGGVATGPRIQRYSRRPSP